MRYGSVPIVSRVGGLADTVNDVEEDGIGGGVTTGFVFGPGTDETLAGALRRARKSFQDKQVWRKLQLNGMSTDVSWRNRASQYAALYHDAIAMRGNQAHLPTHDKTDAESGIVTPVQVGAAGIRPT